ncbi:hypothetical protein D3C81_1214280 [compost metagenome]
MIISVSCSAHGRPSTSVGMNGLMYLQVRSISLRASTPFLMHSRHRLRPASPSCICALTSSAAKIG